MKISKCAVMFSGQPRNYMVLDNYVSRSAQPRKDDFLWLKSQGVTDVFISEQCIFPELILMKN